MNQPESAVMNARMKKLIAPISLSLVVAFTFSACETPGQTAIAGAAAGAAVGGLVHGRGSDALVGAAVGAGAGYLIGTVAQHRRGDRYYRGTGYPVGRTTDRRGIVESPYRPYNLVDVRGIPRGERVVDPSVNRIFINP
jgi:osmotically inducible lipoprotein OsmB